MRNKFRLGSIDVVGVEGMKERWMHQREREGRIEVKTYFYIDVYFILNFIMNLFLILVTALIQQKRCRWIRFLFLSGVNAALSVVFTYFLWGNTVLQMVAALAQIGLFCWMGNVTCFLFLTFFTGGILSAVQSLLARSAAGFLASKAGWMLGTVIFLLAGFYLLRSRILWQKQKQKSIRRVTVIHRGRERTIEALYDTGNQLFSPYTGEGVVIVSKGLSEAISLPEGQHPVLIPYHSIGGSGLLAAYRLEVIQMRDGSCQREVLAAVSEELDARRRIQMILNTTH
jgi:stage II sporulation protein GA (sporulation sigma-E factor processing peptidase)